MAENWTEVDPIYESMVSQEIFESVDLYEKAVEYFTARKVDITGEFIERINEYGLEYEVLTTAFNSCKNLEKAFSRELFPDEICVELNYAAMDWDV